MRLALFDLDHTLLPFDSGMAWTHHATARGLLGPDYAEDYLAACRRHVAGTLDIHALHRQLVAPLAALPRERVDAELAGFGVALAARVPPAVRSLVRAHLDEGDVCVLLTATTRPIARAVAPLFGIDEVLATEPAIDEQGRWSGEIAGEPCFRECKRGHVERWLALRGLTWSALQRSWFYSDSINDVALMEAVSDPVAVKPDVRLREHAVAHSWPILMLD